jgi:hypothetical protein
LVAGIGLLTILFANVGEEGYYAARFPAGCSVVTPWVLIGGEGLIAAVAVASAGIAVVILLRRGRPLAALVWLVTAVILGIAAAVEWAYYGGALFNTYQDLSCPGFGGGD